MMTNRTGEFEPKYMSLYTELKGRILLEEFPTGQLPTESKLMEQYAVSRTTVRKAIEMLRADSLIQSRQGRGTEVTFGSKANNAGQMNRITNVTGVDFSFTSDPIVSTAHSEILVDVVPAAGETARGLQVPDNGQVYRLRWLHYINDQPYLYLTNLLRMDLTPGLPDKVIGVSSLYPMLAREYGLIFQSAEETVKPIVSDFISAKLLDVPVGVPLLELHRTTIFNRGPAEYSRSIIRPDLMQITLKIK